MSRLEDLDSLCWTYITPGPGSTVAVQVYVSERVASSEGISSMVLYTPTDVITAVFISSKLPVTTTCTTLSIAGSSWMVQVRVRGFPW